MHSNQIILWEILLVCMTLHQKCIITCYSQQFNMQTCWSHFVTRARTSCIFQEAEKWWIFLSSWSRNKKDEFFSFQVRQMEKSLLQQDKKFEYNISSFICMKFDAWKRPNDQSLCPMAHACTRGLKNSSHISPPCTIKSSWPVCHEK